MKKLYSKNKKERAKVSAIIGKELHALIKEVKRLPGLGLKTTNIISVKRFGSSVEGKARPNDYDYFVIVKDGSMKFTKKTGLPMPIIKTIGKNQFFIMPESEGENLLNAMLYTGRKDPKRMYGGKTRDITRQFKTLYSQTKGTK